MNCPVCEKAMSEKDFGGVHVDVCDAGCKGIWFDWLELSKLDEKNEGVGEALQAALKHPRANGENRGKLNCPKCALPLHGHVYKDEKEINVDECYGCGGIFLDSGELRPVRDNRMSEIEADAYLDKLLTDNPAFQKGIADQEKDRARAAALAKYARFLRLSYYMTGR